MVVDEQPLGWGYDSQTGTNTNQTCLDVTGAPLVSANQSSMNVDYSWASTKSEANTEIEANLHGDADFGVISGELNGAYEAAFKNNSSAQVLTVAMKIHSVTADVQTAHDPDPDVCVGKSEEMSFAKFLQKCGDRYVSRKEMGGYVFFIGSKQNTSTQERQEISSDLSADFSIGNGGLDGMAKFLEQRDKEGFDFHVVIFGFPELITIFPQPADQIVPNANIVAAKLDDLRQYWQQDAADDVWPGQHYGGVIDQTMKPYQNVFFEDCTNSDDDGSLDCYQDFYEDTRSRLPQYERWFDILGQIYSNQNDYYWGDSASKAQDNKDDYKRVGAIIGKCVDRVSAQMEQCDKIARMSTSKEVDICAACDVDTVYHCDDADQDGLCDTDGAEAQKCTQGNLESLYDALGDVVPKAESPGYGAQSYEMDQYQPDQQLRYSATNICYLAGIQGKMAGGAESVHLYDDGQNWTLDVDSGQGDDDGETLRGRAYCTKLSNFYDGNGNTWSNFAETATSSTNSPVFMFGANNAYIPPKYAAALSGVKGKFEGGAEQAKIDRTNAPFQLIAKSNQTPTTAYANAFGLDSPSGGTIARGGIAYGTTSFSVATQSNPAKTYSRVPMIPIHDGICYLHTIIGDFDGGAEHIRIHKQDGFWELRAKAACKGHSGLFGGGDCDSRKDVQAKATCYLYDQS